MSAPELRSPLGAGIRPGRFGAEEHDPPLLIWERRTAVARVMAHSGKADAVGAAIQEDLRLPLPQPGCAYNVADATALWVAPDAWLVIQTPPDRGDLALRLRNACGTSASVVDQSSGYVVLRLSGARARDVLAKGCRIDLHPRAFGPGRAAATLIAHVHGIVWQVGEAPTFELIVPSSLAEHVFEWLGISAAEFGYEVRA